MKLPTVGLALGMGLAVAEGRARLEQFLEYWGDADLDLPDVADARARLAGS